MTILESIKEAAKKKGVSIKQMEHDLGFGNGSIAKTNEKTQIDRIVQIANYLDVPVEELCGDIVGKLHAQMIYERAKERVDELFLEEEIQKFKHVSETTIGSEDVFEIELVQTYRNADERTKMLVAYALGLEELYANRKKG